ncbi:amidohydrolase family protein [Longimicrobium sp.]|uniref:amidohydrolase family protein n=1 Tax=Longimicrobium sp. TaxID=2029185 RepID=UPI003B3B8DB1
MMRFSVVVAILWMLSGCAAAVPAAAPAPIHRSDIVPLADYHVHLLGPYALPLPDPPAPEVEVPAELSRLLHDRARLFGNVERIEEFGGVFTADARMLNAHVNPTGWMDDRQWFMRYINLWPKTARVRYVPSVYSAGDTHGYVAGTVVDSASGSHFQNFSLGIRRGDDGRWRIATESTTSKTPPRYTQPITAERLIADLDEAGIRRAVVISAGFWLGEGGTRRMTPVEDGATAVRMENDWTAEQVARYPDRLVMACGINPLRDFAVAELVRCSRIPGVIGIKINVGDAGVRFDDPAHVSKLRALFAAANQNGMAMIVHLEPGRFYGPAEVELFLNEIASAAPDVTIQIAHLAGNGPGITSPEALEAFARLRAAGDPRTRNLYFDFAGLVYAGISAAQAELMATRMRQIGLDRILFASDASPGTNANPSADRHWTEVRRRLPLTDEELRIIASNVPPYLR